MHKMLLVLKIFPISGLNISQVIIYLVIALTFFMMLERVGLHRKD